MGRGMMIGGTNGRDWKRIWEEGRKEGDKGTKGIGKWKNKCEGTVLR